jgi:RND family efflux transporter MFP subunit
VVAIKVRAGDAVKAGQLLVELDPRAAADQVRASEAQAAAAQAQLEAAKKDYERQQRLHAQKYISQAAMDQAESQYRASAAQARATLAQAGIATTQATFSRLVAPYAGIVATVSVEQGDLASPGVALLTMYDPTELRVVATVPESFALQLASGRPATVEARTATGAARPIDVGTVQLLPTADPTTHTRLVRIPLPPATGLAPGAFVRASLPITGDGGTRLSVPASAVVRRAGFDAVYVVDAAGRAQLRQVRVGRQQGSDIEVLAGVSAGDRVALDPRSAARQ